MKKLFKFMQLLLKAIKIKIKTNKTKIRGAHHEKIKLKKLCSSKS